MGFKEKQAVAYGSLIGRVDFIIKKTKTVVCTFDENEKEICILFDYDGDLISLGKYITNEKLKEL